MIAPWPFVVLALVVYRLTRFVIADTMIEGCRGALKRWAFEPDGQYRLAIPPFGGNRTAMAVTFARGKVGDLLTCPMCISVWLAAGALYAYGLVTDAYAHTALGLLAFDWLAIAGGVLVIWNLTERDQTANAIKDSL